MDKFINIAKKFSIPAKVQDYLNSILFNFEENGDTLMSPADVIKNNKAHCLEGALLASAIFNYHDIENYLLDLKVKKHARDYDHVVCVFKSGKYFGAVSKTNHNVLRYREPVYESWRELAMTYFHEYFLESGTKTLESFSAPLSTLTLKNNWIDDKDGLWYVSEKLDKIKHYNVVPKILVGKLRKADKIEIQASKLTEYQSS